MKPYKPSYEDLEKKCEELQNSLKFAEAENHLKESENLLNLITDNIPAMIALVDATTLTYNFVNEKYCENFNKSKEQIIGTYIGELIGQRNLDFAIPFINEVREGRPTYYINTFELAGGKKNIKVNYVPVFDQFGKVKDIIVLNYDISELKLVEEELKSITNKLETLINVSPLAITLLDSNDKVQIWNPAAENIFGWTAEEVISLPNPIVPKNLQIEYNLFRSQLTQGIPIINKEVIRQKKDGTLINVNLSSAPIFDESGKITGRMAILADITENKRVEEELSKTKILLEQAFEQSPVPMVLVSMPDAVLRIANPASREFLGMMDEPSVSGTPLMELKVSFKDYDLHGNLGEVKDLPLARSLMGQRTSGEERMIVRKDGTIRWELVNGVPIYNANREIIAGYLIMTDITRQKQTEQQLIDAKDKAEEREVLLNQSQRVAKMGHYVFDIKSGNWKNSEMLDEIFGIDQDYEKNVNGWLEIIHPEDRQEMLSYLQKHVLTDHLNFDKEYKILTIKDKVTRWVHGLGELEFSNNGTLIKMFGVIQDITDKKLSEQALSDRETELKEQNEAYEILNEELQQTNDELILAKEKAEESDRLKSAFLANMSHEIRTPLNAVLGFADLLNSNHSDPEKISRFSSIIKQRGNDLLNLINDILDISKIQANQLTINESVFEINLLLDETYDFFNTQIYLFDKKPNLTLRIGQKISLNQNLAYLDFSRLKQILINLISNAIKFTFQGYIEFGCHIIEDKLKFYVKDTGIGISSDKLSIIFQPFRQVDNKKLNQASSGTGLGLAICKGLTDLMNGTITVESVENIGSEFIVTIPFRPAIKEKILSHAFPEKVFNWENKTILIVEDDESCILLLNEMFQETKAKIIVVQTGKQALEIIDQNIYVNLILMDIRLPDIDGNELTKIIKKLKPKIPIIAQTANAMETDRLKCLNAGCDDYISKPIQKQKLQDLIQKYIR